ncbi:MAG: glycosyltransferase [Bacteroidota bacterium]
MAGGGTSNFIEEHNLGYLVDPDNLDDFVAAAKELLSLPQERLKEIAVRARRLCKDEFSIDAAVQKRLEYWKSEINEHPN